jgi:hypothetical protein
MILDKSFEEINEADLLLLVESKIPEKRNIEYKLDLPLDSNEGKKKFLADISSLANAAGGHIIFGVQEENGLPMAIPGVRSDDPDGEILRLENIMRDGIEPRLQGVSAKSIALSSGTHAFILRIPRSWSRPHVVNYKNHWRFYSRNSAGKYQLDVSEVCLAFLQSSELAGRIRLFRDERLGSIISEQTPARLLPGARIILHLIPYASFDVAASFPLDEIAKEPYYVKLINSSMSNWRYNFDGILITSTEAEEVQGYVQIYRNGIIEAVEVSMLRPQGDRRLIPSIVFEEELIEATKNYLEIQHQITVPPPVSILISLVGVSGYFMEVNHRIGLWNEKRHPIDRDTLILPELIFESIPPDIPRALKPAFDAVWNATGLPASLTYNSQGEWRKGPNK